MKRILTIFIIFSIFCNITITAQTQIKSTSNTTKFIKGNISDKTAAVRDAVDTEAGWITTKAIEFCLENKTLLGNDRELDALAVAAILSVSPDLLKSNERSEEESAKKVIADLSSLFLNFNKSSTVQIAVITKMLALKDSLPYEAFTVILNEYIRTTDLKDIDSGVFKACISALENIGDNESFTILYGLLNNNKYASFHKEIEAATISLIPSAMDDVLNMISGADLKKLNTIFTLTQKNSKISNKNLCEISEKVLIETILLTENSSGISTADTEVQLSALKVLSDNNWTRASQTVLNYFILSKQQYDKNNMKENDFITVITSLKNIAPLNAVTPLINYLEELNSRTESGKIVSSDVMLALINTLGAIGDKAAFDSLLAVTWLNYEESVLTAASKALSGLRWQ